MSGIGQQAFVDPTREQFRAFQALPQNEAIHMLNLVRLRDLAAYREGHPDHGKGVTGLEAYRKYGHSTAPIFKRLGGRHVWVGRPEALVIGPGDEYWDIAFIAEYPSAAAFVSMVRDPEYREFVKHRQAAVADSRLIRMKPLVPGEGFGEARA